MVDDIGDNTIWMQDICVFILAGGLSAGNFATICEKLNFVNKIIGIFFILHSKGP
jgi:hypothetical protein